LPETAGFLMKTNIPTINEDLKVGDIEEMLLKKASQFETIGYIYILDKFQRLKGVLSIKELYGIEKNQLIKNHFVKNPVSSRPSVDQERVALLAVRHNIKAVPVVDKKNKGGKSKNR
jgi:magnesium transporter